MSYFKILEGVKEVKVTDNERKKSRKTGGENKWEIETASCCL